MDTFHDIEALRAARAAVKTADMIRTDFDWLRAGHAVDQWPQGGKYVSGMFVEFWTFGDKLDGTKPLGP